jgi:hypothetical protein
VATAKAAGSVITGSVVTASLMVILMNLLIGGGLNMLWNLMNAVQIVSFVPLMSVKPPPIIIVFFETLNFINLDIPIVSDKSRGKFDYIRTYEGWMSNFSLFGSMSEIMFFNQTSTLISLVIILTICGGVMVYFIRSKSAKDKLKSLLKSLKFFIPLNFLV